MTGRHIEYKNHDILNYRQLSLDVNQSSFFVLVRYSLQMAKTRLERFPSSGVALPRKCLLMLITSASHVSILKYIFHEIHHLFVNISTVFNILKFNLAVRPRGHKQMKLNDMFIHSFVCVL